MPGSLYDRDILEWSQRQAERLRRVAKGERVNDVDWEHVAEEIEEVGRSELNSVQSLLRQALLHVQEAAAWPQSSAAAHWTLGAGTFLADAQQRFAPSMRRHVSVTQLYARALVQVRGVRIDGRPPAPLPDVCPFTLDELLADPPDVAALVARLAGPAPDRRAGLA